jgi:Right handed beta helix region
MVGTRNNEMQRFLIGDIAEIIVYPRALNVSERTTVYEYLSAKWNIASPKHCSPPQPPQGQVQINFAYGGFQEARGSGINAGQHFYIENVLEELDVPGEWYYDSTGGLLYLMPNVSQAVLNAATISMPILHTLIAVNGSQSATNAYATDISFVGFTITESRITFLEQYEVPSGGDWSVHRGAAIFVQDSERIQLSNLTVQYTGGNGVIFSNHVLNSTISDSEFTHNGDSAIILLGSTNGVDGSLPTYPDRNIITRNHIHEIGMYGKQVSCIGLQLSANTTMTDNVCYNGPRAGINFSMFLERILS